MRKFLPVSFLALLIPLNAMAQQEYPRVEVFGGYSYLRANPEELNLNGWNASFAGNLTDWFGVEADFSGHYASPNEFPFSGVDINHYTFMGGPKLALRSGPITPFAHFLIGAARAGTSEFGASTSDYALAAAIGGGIDFNLSSVVAVRVFQADYLMTRFVDERQNNFRFSAGLVFRLGNH